MSKTRPSQHQDPQHELEATGKVMRCLLPPADLALVHRALTRFAHLYGPVGPDARDRERVETLAAHVFSPPLVHAHRPAGLIPTETTHTLPGRKVVITSMPAARHDITLEGPVSVPCSRCGVKAGQACRYRNGKARPAHTERRSLFLARQQASRSRVRIAKRHRGGPNGEHA